MEEATELEWITHKYKGCGHTGRYPVFFKPGYWEFVCPLCQEENELLAIVFPDEWKKRYDKYLENLRNN